MARESENRLCMHIRLNSSHAFYHFLLSGDWHAWFHFAITKLLPSAAQRSLKPVLYCKPIASLLRQPSEACILKSTLYIDYRNKFAINLQLMLNFMSILYVYSTIGSQVISHKKLANQVEYEKNNRL